MSVLVRIKSLNGWQRVWLLVSAFLFISIVLLPREEMGATPTYALLVELDDPVCQDLISKWEKSTDKKAYTKTLVNALKRDDEELRFSNTSNFLKCYSVINAIEKNNEVPSRTKTYLKDKIEGIGKFIGLVLLWGFIIMILYGIGLIGRWIRRGGL